MQIGDILCHPLKNNNMGKMKQLMIDQMNNQRNPDDTDWDYLSNQMAPPPDQLDLDSGKSMWIIEDYKIWAFSYKEAMELLPLIKSF